SPPMAPIRVLVPSPKLRMPPVILAPLAGVTVNVIGVPAGPNVGFAAKVASGLVPTVTVTELAPFAPLPPPVSLGAPAIRAVSVAFAAVVSVVVATPLASEIAVVGDTVPAEVVNVTGMFASPEPPTSAMTAVIVDEPPV